MILREQQIGKHLHDAYGLAVLRVVRIDHGVMNENYRCRTATGDVVCKVYRSKSVAEVQFEASVLGQLERKQFCSPRLMPTQSGSFVSTIEGQACIIYRYIDGTTIREEQIDEQMLGQIGEAIGDMHTALTGFVQTSAKPTWDPEAFQSLVETRGQELVDRQFPDADGILSFVKKEMQQFQFPLLPTGVTHQDVKPENIILDPNRRIVGIVDFDNSYVGALIHDLTTTAIWTCMKDATLYEPFVMALRKGYESRRPFTGEEDRCFADALKWRLVREIFIGPCVTVGHDAVIAKRTQEFLTAFHSLS